MVQMKRFYKGNEQTGRKSEVWVVEGGSKVPVYKSPS